MTARARKEKPPPYRDALTFTLPDAATISGLSVATLRRRAAEGGLRFVRVGSRTLVQGDSLRDLLGIAATK